MAFTCQTDGISQICWSPPSIQYSVTGTYEGNSVRVFGSSRDEACLNWAAATPDPTVPWQYSPLIYCYFHYTNSNGYTGPWISGDNREIKVCPVNAVMYDSSGQFLAQNVGTAGAMSLLPTIATAMPESATPFPQTVMAVEHTHREYGIAMCVMRGAAIPTRNFGETCPRMGNPITLGVEVKTQREVDYDRSGALRFVRTYHSGAGTTYYTGVLGKGWQHNVAVRVSANANSAPSGAVTAALSISPW